MQTRPARLATRYSPVITRITKSNFMEPRTCQIIYQAVIRKLSPPNLSKFFSKKMGRTFLVSFLLQVEKSLVQYARTLESTLLALSEPVLAAIGPTAKRSRPEMIHLTGS